MSNRGGALVLSSIVGFCFLGVFAYSYFGSEQIKSDGNDEPGICGEVKYDEIFDLPLGLSGYFDYDEALACAREQGKPLLVYFNGYGCVNCREVEANVWSDLHILKMLNEDFVIASLYVDDKTPLEEDEWYVSKFDGRIKKTIGTKNNDFQMSRPQQSSAQPTYYVLNNNEDLISPQVGYTRDIYEFHSFLQDAQVQFLSNRR